MAQPVQAAAGAAAAGEQPGGAPVACKSETRDIQPGRSQLTCFQRLAICKLRFVLPPRRTSSTQLQHPQLPRRHRRRAARPQAASGGASTGLQCRAARSCWWTRQQPPVWTPAPRASQHVCCITAPGPLHAPERPSGAQKQRLASVCGRAWRLTHWTPGNTRPARARLAMRPSDPARR